MSENKNKKIPIFNGHTWIVIIIAISFLFILAAGAMVGLFYIEITINNQESSLKILEGGGIVSIPFIVVKGIINIVDRLTYLQKGDN